jgi:hypothetical protein
VFGEILRHGRNSCECIAAGASGADVDVRVLIVLARLKLPLLLLLLLCPAPALLLLAPALVCGRIQTPHRLGAFLRKHRWSRRDRVDRVHCSAAARAHPARVGPFGGGGPPGSCARASAAACAAASSCSLPFSSITTSRRHTNTAPAHAAR